MTKIRAVVYDSYGGPDVLYETRIDMPSPTPNEVLIRIHAVSVNGYDLGARSGALKMFIGRKFPKRIGLDFAGEITTAAASAPQFKLGDRVWGTMPLNQLGSAAEFVCVAPTQLSHYPTGLDPVEATALPVVGSTAITALRDIGRLQPGGRLLVRGASGGVGSVAVQLGRALGAHVTGLASAPNLDFVRDLGAEIALDYTVTTPEHLGAFDVILDTIGSNARRWRHLLASNGRMIAIVPDLEHPLLSMTYIALSRIHGARRVRFFSDKPDTKLLTDLAAYVKAGAIKPIVEKVYPLSSIADAHRALEAGGRRGKQVVRVT